MVSSSLTSVNLTAVLLKLVTEFVCLYFKAPDTCNFKRIIISQTRTLKQPYRIHNTGVSCQNVRQLANKVPCFMQSKLRFRTHESLPHNNTRRLHLDHDFTAHFPTFLFNFVHSCQQKSIGLKFSKSRTGNDVRYSCHHNSSRFTFPTFAHSCRFSVLHSLQSITPRIY